MRWIGFSVTKCARGTSGFGKNQTQGKHMTMSTLSVLAVAFLPLVLPAQTLTNLPPSVAIINPTNNSRFDAPADIPVWANAIDRDGEVVEVSFFANQHYIGGVTNPPPVLSPLPPWRILWEKVPAGLYSLQARATDNRGARAWSESVRIEVRSTNPPPTLPVINVLANDPEASEGSFTSGPTSGSFLFTRTGGNIDNSLTVFIRLSGTASNGLDYREIGQSVTFAAGASSLQVPVHPLDDRQVEPTETVIVRIDPPLCAAVVPPPPGCYMPGSNFTATVFIRDARVETNSPPIVRLISPTNESRFPEGATIRVCADAFDHTLYVDTVEFFANDRSLGVVTNNPYSLAPYVPYCVVWSNAPAGDYVLTAKATDNFGLMATSAPVRISVGGSPPPPELPVVNVSANDPEAAEGGTRTWPQSGSFLFTRTGSTASPLTIEFEISGTASNGLDYQRIANSVTFAAGSAFAQIRVQPIEDGQTEPTETVVVTIEDPACAAIVPPPPGCYRTGPSNTATVFIRDAVIESNSPPVVRIFSPTNESQFPAGADIRICASATDFTRYVDTVEFFANDHSLGIKTNNPFVLAPSAGFCIVWSNAPSGDHVLTAKATDNFGLMAISAPVQITVGITNPPPPPPTNIVLTIQAVDPVAAEQDPRIDALSDSALLVVQRHGPTNVALIVEYRVGGSASNGVDYARLSGRVEMPAGARRAEIVIDALDDSLVEGTETSIVGLMEPVCSGILPRPPECYRVGLPGTAIAYIRDNDSAPSNSPPAVRITAPANGDTFRAGSDIQIEAVTVDRDGYAPMVEFFANGRKIGEQTIHFIDRPPNGAPIEFSFVWSNVLAGSYTLTAKATDNGGAMAFSGPVGIRVGTNEPPPPPTNVVVQITAVDAYAVEGPFTNSTIRGTNIASFVVGRAGPTNEAVTVRYHVGGTASNGLDYAELSGQATIAAGARAARIVILPIDDGLAEGIETVVLELAHSHTDPPSYTVGRSSRAAAIIVDNDALHPRTTELAGSLFHVCLPGTDGVAYRLEASSNLIDWVTLGTGVVSDGVIHFVDPDVQALSYRFYRAVPDATALVE
jgi:hypothetical protein